MASIKRKALVVLGMHRSGTSALGGVLARLGAQAPRTQMPPTPDNPRGYMESVRFMKFHDDILTSSGSRWNDWGRFNPDWFESDAALEFRTQVPVLLDKEFGDAPIFVLKDPRICRFFPFWVQACLDLDIDLKVIIPLRSPSEVARSLRARDRFGRARSMLLWLRHVLDAEYASRGTDRSFLRYSDLLDDWRTEAARLSRQLKVKWPRWSSEVEAEIDEYLDAELRRQRSDSRSPIDGNELVALVRAVDDALGLMVDEPGEHAEAKRILDEIRTEFDRTSAIYRVVVHEEVAEAKSEVEETRRLLTSGTEELDRVARQLHEADLKLASDQEESQQLKDRIAHLDTELVRHVQLAEAASRASESLTVQVAAQLRTISEAQTLLGEQGAAIGRLMTELAQKDGLLEARSLELAALRERLDNAEAERGNYEAGFREQESLASRLRSEAADYAERLSGAESELERLKRCEFDLRQMVATKEREIAEKEQALESLDATCAEQQAELESVKLEVQRAEGDVGKLVSRVKMLEGEILRIREREVTASRELATLSNSLLTAEQRARQTRSEYDRMQSRMQAEVAIEREERSKLLRRLEAMQLSTSWRLTAPLRSMSAAFRPPADATRRRNAERDALALRKSGLFDEAWYLEKYPDVRESGIDPIVHYLRFGAKESRNPSAIFSTSEYLKKHPELLDGGVNPLLHYARNK